MKYKRSEHTEVRKWVKIIPLKEMEEIKEQNKEKCLNQWLRQVKNIKPSNREAHNTFYISSDLLGTGHSNSPSEDWNF